MKRTWSFTINPLAIVCIALITWGVVDYLQEPPPAQIDHTKDLKVIVRRLDAFEWDIKRVNNRIDESFTELEGSFDKRFDSIEKRIDLLENQTEASVAPKPPQSPSPEKPVVRDYVPLLESFAMYVAREYKGRSWVESNRNDASVNHLVKVHGWNRDEISKLNRQQRMRLHGASHSGQVDALRSRYNKLYGLNN